MKTQDFRKPSDHELLIFRKLASLDFLAKSKMSDQIDTLSVRSVDGNGSLALQTCSDFNLPIRQGVLVEARCPDQTSRDDSSPQINILVHVKEGKLHLLEIYKDDGTAIIGEIETKKFRIFSRLDKTGFQ